MVLLLDRCRSTLLKTLGLGRTPIIHSGFFDSGFHLFFLPFVVENPSVEDRFC